MLKLKLHTFGQLMRSANSLEKTLMLGMIEGGGEGSDREHGQVASLTPRTLIWVTSGKFWRTRKPGVLQSMGYKQSDMTEQLNNNKWHLSQDLLLPSLAAQFSIKEAPFGFVKPKAWASSSPHFQGRATGSQLGVGGERDSKMPLFWPFQAEILFQTKAAESSGISSFIQPQFVGWKFCPEGNRLRALGPLMSSFQSTVEWNVYSGRSKKRPPDPLALPSFLLIK